MGELTNDMLVNDLLKCIENKEISVKEVAELFASSERTIQKKIKALGFNWDHKQAKYSFTGSNEQQSMVEFLTIDKVFNKGSNQQNASKNTNGIDNQKNVVKAIKDSGVKDIELVNKNTIKKASIDNDFGASDMDRIDELLSGKKASKKYIGFYATDDVAGVLDSIEGRIKSELINECLRVVFKSKGLL